MAGFGAYAFIPDAGFVGTVFVNAMSNLSLGMQNGLLLHKGQWQWTVARLRCLRMLEIV